MKIEVDLSCISKLIRFAPKVVSLDIKMKLFQTIQKNHAIVGIRSNQTHAINGRVVVTFSIYVLGFTSCAIYLFHEANTFFEYSSNMFLTTGLIMIIVVYAIIFFKITKLFELISDCERVFDRSK